VGTTKGAGQDEELRELLAAAEETWPSLQQVHNTLLPVAFPPVPPYYRSTTSIPGTAMPAVLLLHAPAHGCGCPRVADTLAGGVCHIRTDRQCGAGLRRADRSRL
jgi:hypothetical protein